ncbi:MAG: tripartite tricarboxylate transporter substrate binding protein [Betaproteobacteria bacterium]|nr:tripartite tricarboxylate transporter substrate binding protein [Betaproteobacteria bacterium]
MTMRWLAAVRICLLSALQLFAGSAGMAVVVAPLLWLWPDAASAQKFPSKPLRIVVRAPPGGADDLHARVMAPRLGDVLGQRVIPDYRPGAGGLVAWEIVAKSPPDGYTLLLAASGLAAIRSLRADATAVDPWRDFAWVSQVANFPLVLTVHPSLPTKTLKDLVALARKRPGELNYGSSGVGATPHLAAEYFKAVAKIDIRHVPYKGASPMYLDLLGGRIEMGASVIGSAIPHIRNGKLRAMGVTSVTRSAQLPEAPTIAEGGFPGFEFLPFYALVVAAGTPREIVSTLSEAIGKTISTPEVREQIIRAGSEPASNTPEQMLQLARKGAAQIEEIVRTANIKPE